jgi:hypothetical protein
LKILRALAFPVINGMCVAPLSALATGKTALLQSIASPGPATTVQQQGPTPPLLGQPIERELSGAQTRSCRLNIQDHQYARVVVEQHGIDVMVQLLDNSGAGLAEYNSESRLTGVATLGIVADTAAVYQLKIKAISGHSFIQSGEWANLAGKR